MLINSDRNPQNDRTRQNNISFVNKVLDPPLQDNFVSKELHSIRPSRHIDFGISQPVILYLENLLSKNEQKKGKSSFLVFKHGKYLTIKTKDIAFFYINNDIPTIMSFEGTVYSISLSLDEVNKLIPGPKFFRINRRYLVNFSAIKEVEHYYSRKLLVKLKLSLAEDLIVCRDKATVFLAWLDNR